MVLAMDISKQFKHKKNGIYLENNNGENIAYVEYFLEENKVANIDHTYVDPILRGQNVADKLLMAVNEKLNLEGYTIKPTCSYAIKWYEKHPELSGTLVILKSDAEN